jgi:hypothetical protein
MSDMPRNTSPSLPPYEPIVAPTAPRERCGRLFLRFLRFGALAWGGPVVQIRYDPARVGGRNHESAATAFSARRRFTRLCRDLKPTNCVSISACWRAHMWAACSRF